MSGIVVERDRYRLEVAPNGLLARRALATQTSYDRFLDHLEREGVVPLRIDDGAS